MTAPINAIDDPRRTALVRQARQHFITEGYVGTRMEPIAREAGISTATLYAMFENKAALFAAVIEEAAADFTVRMSAVQNCTGSPQERLLGFLTTYADFMSDAFVQPFSAWSSRNGRDLKPWPSPFSTRRRTISAGR